MLSKACVVAQYQSKLQALAEEPALELTVAVPPEWRDERGTLRLEQTDRVGYKMEMLPIRFNGHFHIHYYPTLAELIARVQPHIIHLDEEPYNFVTYHAVRQAQRIAPQAHRLFFSWQNIKRSYPPPFSWMEQYVYRHVDAAIAGSYAAQQVLFAKGFGKPIRLIPQFGVPASFSPDTNLTRNPSQIVIGYAGRLVEEKGVTLLLRALALVQANWSLQILGSGPLRRQLGRLARALNLNRRVHFTDWVASTEMPRFYNSLDLLVVPSLTQPNWKEQFGRVVMEAMACGVPVIGSSSGEIPNVIGDAGIIFPEGDVNALGQSIAGLVADPALRRALADKGLARAQSLFSQERVVDDTYQLYCELLQAESAYPRQNL